MNSVRVKTILIRGSLPQKTNWESGVNDASKGILLLLVKPCNRLKHHSHISPVKTQTASIINVYEWFNTVILHCDFYMSCTTRYTSIRETFFCQLNTYQHINKEFKTKWRNVETLTKLRLIHQQALALQKNGFSPFSAVSCRKKWYLP